MYEVGIVEQFEAAHRLPDFGSAARTHGHTYRVEIAVRGPCLRTDGTLVDIAVLQEAARTVTAELHYQDLDQLLPFQGRRSTAEVVAQAIAIQIAPALANRELAALSVRVWESPLAFAGYEQELD